MGAPNCSAPPPGDWCALNAADDAEEGRFDCGTVVEDTNGVKGVVGEITPLVPAAAEAPRPAEGGGDGAGVGCVFGEPTGTGAPAPAAAEPEDENGLNMRSSRPVTVFSGFDDAPVGFAGFDAVVAAAVAEDTTGDVSDAVNKFSWLLDTERVGMPAGSPAEFADGPAVGENPSCDTAVFDPLWFAECRVDPLALCGDDGPGEETFEAVAEVLPERLLRPKGSSRAACAAAAAA